jgi:hypothetical protein
MIMNGWSSVFVALGARNAAQTKPARTAAPPARFPVGASRAGNIITYIFQYIIYFL